MRVVEPVSHPLAEFLPVRAILPHALAAKAIELLDAEFFDVLLAADAERLLDFDLHRQTVRVPSRLPRDVEPAHRAMPAEEILQRAREHVVDARPSVGRRRALEEHELRRIFAGRERPAKEILARPPREHFLFQLARRAGQGASDP